MSNHLTRPPVCSHIIYQEDRCFACRAQRRKSLEHLMPLQTSSDLQEPPKLAKEEAVRKVGELKESEPEAGMKSDHLDAEAKGGDGESSTGTKEEAGPSSTIPASARPEASNQKKTLRSSRHRKVL
ncbi:hypothetical protein MBM_01385 [Drepanopeziza brunnea f. sp. 'multigermtubi' MB_m1]|uniref:Uncharacterized protein n=1 Tax=Marssonina brunnea f. sp. multigermtubi (strain MB_m1) TaxID=1072389 RepID=K1XJ45_MARBU|nr:uncharacterized protein MBM_01385 [Drepanopeziza brunnea f. sp. 'multigermtubi' MB_m1]EKD20703.1 hypothetical protein MBM_01385 [Drepanopeziza brunnea f. sp. 'multigermtubi' MB_m1]